jgi:hypothetical protein
MYPHTHTHTHTRTHTHTHTLTHTHTHTPPPQQQQQQQQQNRYDYNPEEHLEEGDELSGHEMTMIKDSIVEVRGEPDDVGFYETSLTLTGPLKGKSGEVPGNFVESVTALVSPDLYRARFDYNPEAHLDEESVGEEDMAFKAGDVIRLMTPKHNDPDGFYDAVGIVGSCAHVRGMVS